MNAFSLKEITEENSDALAVYSVPVMFSERVLYTLAVFQGTRKGKRGKLMVYSVVLVDENVTAVSFLKQRFRLENVECTVVGTATDGLSGLELILRLRPQIVVSDVSLPGQSGLDMMEQVLQALPACRFILYSDRECYQELSRAVHLGVVDFLQKPVEQGVLFNAIGKAVKQLHGKQDGSAFADRLARRRSLLYDYLTNESRHGMRDRQVDDVLNFDACYIMVLQQQNRTYSQALMNLIEVILKQKVRDSTVLLLYDIVVIFIVYQGNREKWRNQAAVIADTLIAECRESILIGISELGFSRQTIRSLYLHARKALWEMRLRSHEDKRNFYIPPEEGASYEGDINIASAVCDLMDRADLTTASMKEIVPKLMELSSGQFSILRAMLALYAFTLQKKYPDCGDPDTNQILYRIWYVTTREEAEECMQSLLDTLNRARKKPVLSLTTRHALRSIQLHAARGISLDEAADELGISPKYLSFLIKQETGINFHDHVLRMKMSIAKAMLNDPRNRVEDIATAVGYSNYISFFNAFKRSEHMSPTDYRNHKVGL